MKGNRVDSTVDTGSEASVELPWLIGLTTP